MTKQKLFTFIVSNVMISTYTHVIIITIRSISIAISYHQLPYFEWFLRVPVALIKHLDQKQLAGKDLFHLHFWIAALTEGSNGRNSNRVGTRGRNWSRDYGRVLHISLILMICWGCFSWHSDLLIQGYYAHSEMDRMMSIINEENALQVCPQANLMGAVS